MPCDRSARGKQGCLLFDWGDTLMRVFPDYDGPMVDWPRVEAIPHAAETLATLRDDWILAVATNAEASGAEQIRAALDRAGLGTLIDQIYCFREIGHRKPSRQFFEHILDELGMPASQVVMVGDSLDGDVLGAAACGIPAVWFDEAAVESRPGEPYTKIHDFRELPAALQRIRNRTQGKAD